MGSILEKASATWTNTGRKVKVEQAAKVFRLLGTKASRAIGDSDAENQAVLCAAVIDRLKPHYR